MKTTLTLLFSLFCITVYSQPKVQRDNFGNFQQIATVRVKKEPVKTSYTYTDSKGRVWDVYTTDAGKYFIIRTSAKTGKQYRQYLKQEQY